MRFVYNILICDDDRDIAAALRIYLSGEDYRILEAHTGREALEAVRSTARCSSSSWTS
jgi:DNA-binding response OmpR family regulator